MSIVPRAGGLANLSYARFRELMSHVEEDLKKMIGAEEYIFFHKHKGFFESENNGIKSELEISSWSKDGIHPNLPEGRRKYKKSLRNAIFRALKMF
jgi:hypothetical protein